MYRCAYLLLRWLFSNYNYEGVCHFAFTSPAAYEITRRFIRRYRALTHTPIPQFLYTQPNLCFPAWRVHIDGRWRWRFTWKTLDREAEEVLNRGWEEYLVPRTPPQRLIEGELTFVEKTRAARALLRNARRARLFRKK